MEHQAYQEGANDQLSYEMYTFALMVKLCLSIEACLLLSLGFFYHVKFIKGRKNTQCLSICLVLYFTSFTALLYKLCPHILLLQCVVHGSKDQWTQMTTCSSTIRQGQSNIYFMHESHGLHLKGTKSCDHFRSVDWPCYINIWLVVKIKRHT